MLMETDLAGALLGYCSGKKILAISEDGKTVFDFDGHMAALTKIRFLTDVADIKVNSAIAKQAETQDRDLTEKVKPKSKGGQKKSASEHRVYADKKHGIFVRDKIFDYGKLNALINAGKDVEFLCVEFGMSRAEIDEKIFELPQKLAEMARKDD